MFTSLECSTTGLPIPTTQLRDSWWLMKKVSRDSKVTCSKPNFWIFYFWHFGTKSNKKFRFEIFVRNWPFSRNWSFWPKCHVKFRLVNWPFLQNDIFGSKIVVFRPKSKKMVQNSGFLFEIDHFERNFSIWDSELEFSDKKSREISTRKLAFVTKMIFSVQKWLFNNQKHVWMI